MRARDVCTTDQIGEGGACDPGRTPQVANFMYAAGLVDRAGSTRTCLWEECVRLSDIFIEA